MPFSTAMLLLLLPMWAYCVGPKRPALSSAIGLLGSAWLPFSLPHDAGVWQLVASGWAVVYAAKSWERAHDNPCDPRMMTSLPRFMLWWFAVLDTRLPTAQTGGAQLLSQAKLRLMRGLAKLAAAALLVALNGRLQVDWSAPYVLCAWAMALLYPLVSGLADVVTGSFMLLGVEVAEPFRAPMFATSPRDFWSRRWNRFVSTFARRNIYWRMGGRRHPGRATMAVFVTSGAMHEYLVIACQRGVGSYTGLCLAFFVLHGAIVLVDTRLGLFRRWSPAKACAAHLALLWLTSPLLFVPLDESVGFSRWGR